MVSYGKRHDRVRNYSASLSIPRSSEIAVTSIIKSNIISLNFLISGREVRIRRGVDENDEVMIHLVMQTPEQKASTCGEVAWQLNLR